MTVVTKTAMPIDNAALAQPMRARRPVDFSPCSTALRPPIRLATRRCSTSSDPAELNLGELDAVLDHGSKIYWQYMRPAGKPSFTLGLLRDMKASIDHLTRIFADSSAVRSRRCATPSWLRACLASSTWAAICVTSPS